jgi:hypothetical protein
MAQPPASIRFNNPGAQYPGPSARKFGSIGTEIIGGGHKIAVFDDPVRGAAAQFDLLDRSYAGMTLGQAIKKWSGGNSSPAYAAHISKATGIPLESRLTPEMLRDPTVAVPFAKASADWEAGGKYPMTDEQWKAAHAMAFGGSATEPTQNGDKDMFWFAPLLASIMGTGGAAAAGAAGAGAAGAGLAGAAGAGAAGAGAGLAGAAGAAGAGAGAGLAGAAGAGAGAGLASAAPAAIGAAAPYAAGAGAAGAAAPAAAAPAAGSGTFASMFGKDLPFSMGGGQGGVSLGNSGISVAGNPQGADGAMKASAGGGNQLLGMRHQQPNIDIARIAQVLQQRRRLGTG